MDHPIIEGPKKRSALPLPLLFKHRLPFCPKLAFDPQHLSFPQPLH